MLALATTSIAWVIFAVILVGWLVYFILNQGSARAELGSEIELAPNRKPYYDDDALEGRRLTRVTLLNALLLMVLAIALPLYWVFEPGRQADAKDGRDARFADWGGALFATTADGGFNCAGCHGGMKGEGASAAAAVTDSTTGETKAVQWYAPALNSVLYRYSEDEVRYILTYGRPFSPMAAWGTEGGGPMNFQQIDTLIAYIKSIQIPRVDCAPGEDDARICPSGHLPESVQDTIQADATRAAEDLVAQGRYATVEDAMGEALFTLDTSSGAYSCARCHTEGWSYGDPGQNGQGAFGWNLTGGSTVAKFPNEDDMFAFIKNGSVDGQKYGTQGQGSGKMPGFGNMLTDEQIHQIMNYVRSL